jgi:hypothetical protein
MNLNLREHWESAVADAFQHGHPGDLPNIFLLHGGHGRNWRATLIASIGGSSGPVVPNVLAGLSSGCGC